MSIRTLELLATPPPPHFVGDGFRVHNFIPGTQGISMQRMNPFILLDYNAKYYFGPTDKPRGVDVHPHRGFETVTIVYDGAVQHLDSAGGGGIIRKGDVQWMTTASGVLHKEFHEKEWSKKGGDFHIVQLWVNLPAKYKMSAPKYQGIENKNISKHILDNNSGVIEIIAGEYNQTKGVASTFTPLHLMNAYLNKNGVATFDFPNHYSTAFLVISGKVKLNKEQEIFENNFVLLSNSGNTFEIEATEDATVLVLSGEPINEPIAAHGPFVMNTRAELLQAFNDFNQGKFGVLE